MNYQPNTPVADWNDNKLRTGGVPLTVRLIIEYRDDIIDFIISELIGETFSYIMADGQLGTGDVLYGPGSLPLPTFIPRNEKLNNLPLQQDVPPPPKQEIAPLPKKVE